MLGYKIPFLQDKIGPITILLQFSFKNGALFQREKREFHTVQSRWSHVIIGKLTVTEFWKVMTAV